MSPALNSNDLPPLPDSKPKPETPAVLKLADLIAPAKPEQVVAEEAVREIGGRQNGLDPTRYGDWEKDGRCIDF